MDHCIVGAVNGKQRVSFFKGGTVKAVIRTVDERADVIQQFGSLGGVESRGNNHPAQIVLLNGLDSGTRE